MATATKAPKVKAPKVKAPKVKAPKVKAPRVRRIVREITNQTEADCCIHLFVQVEFEQGDFANRTISGIINRETLTISFKTETECEAYLHELACDRIAADAQERDLAVAATEAAIGALVADVAEANADRCTCGGILAGDGCTNRSCVNFPPTLAADAKIVSVETPMDGYIAWIIERPEPKPSPYASLFTAQVTTPSGDTWASLPRASFQAAHDEIAAYFFPAPLPPFIYYSPDGFTWAGAPECYTNWIDADVARDEMLAA